MKYLLFMFLFLVCSTAFGSQDIINGVVVEDSVLSDEVGNQYNTKMIYPEGVLQNSLALHLIKTNDVPQKTRIALYGTNHILPINETGIDDTVPALNVWGDMSLGDILAIERNPMRYFKRIETGLSSSAITTMYSAKYGARDIDGGGFIQLAPNERGNKNDGYVNLTAFGLGSGKLSNTVFMRARKTIDTIEEIAVFSGRNNISPGQTTMSLMIHDGRGLRFERVYVGAPNSGGPGRRALTIDN